MIRVQSCAMSIVNHFMTIEKHTKCTPEIQKRNNRKRQKSEDPNLHHSNTFLHNCQPHLRHTQAPVRECGLDAAPKPSAHTMIHVFRDSRAPLTPDLHPPPRESDGRGHTGAERGRGGCKGKSQNGSKMKREKKTDMS